MAALGQQSIGSTVKLNIDGSATDFIVVHQGLPGSMYDVSCDGTWLLMTNIYTKISWGTATNGYGNSSAHSYLNTLTGAFDIKDLVKQVKIPYRVGSSNDLTVKDGTEGLSTKLFLLSYWEVGRDSANYPLDGAALDYFNGTPDSQRIAYLDDTATNWWLRTPHYSTSSYVTFINSTGKAGAISGNTSYGIRPALILPYELNVADNGLVDGTIASAGAITGSVNIGGELRELTGKGYINIGGELRELCDAKINIDGKLRSLKG